MKPNSYVIGDALEELRKLPDNCVHCCVTSPPYWNLRDYGPRTWFGGDADCTHASGDGQAATTSTCTACGAWYGQLGLEETPEAFVVHMVEVFEEVRRVLRDDGTLWLNVGDTYARGGGMRGPHKGKNSVVSHAAMMTKGVTVSGGKPNGLLKRKDLVGIPWMLAFALRDAGWYLRCDMIWHKSNPLPESVKDRPGRAHEYLFLMSKSEYYHYDADAVREPHQDRAGGPERFGEKGQRSVGQKHDSTGHARARQVSHTPPGRGYDSRGRNRRSVWTVPTYAYAGAHFACFPPALITPCILAGCPPGGIVLDPFLGSGTTAMVAESLGRRWFGIELNPEYEPLIKERTKQMGLAFSAEPSP